MQYVSSVTDTQSSYINNTAQAGGVYYIVGKVTAVSTVSLTNNDYNFNYGALGGVLALFDYFDVTIYECTFEFNRGTNGGAIYVSELSSNE